MTVILGVLLFGGAGLVLVWALSGSREVAHDGDPATMNVHQEGLRAGGFERLVFPLLSGLGAKLARLLPPGRIQALRLRIILAGKQNTWNVEKAMALKVLSLVVAVVGIFALLTFWKVSLLSLVLSGLLGFMGWFAVEYYLDKTAAARQMEITQALPDVLDQITVCVEAGLGFDAALNRIARTNDNVLADELGRTLQDIRLGVPRTQALHSLLDRTDVQDLRLFVRALIQAERSGIPIARVLTVQSDEVREKRRQAAEERAMKLPVLLIMPLVLCILPSLFTVIMGPAALRMIKEGAV